MKVFLILISGFVLANAIPLSKDLKGDVGVPQNQHLPPENNFSPTSATESAAAETNDPNALAVTTDGCSYQIERKLRYRNRRDVSHLDLAYLPPQAPILKENLFPLELNEPITTELLPVDIPSSNEYLPPVAAVKDQPVVTEMPENVISHADLKETEIKTPLQPSNEYLPPAVDIRDTEAATEQPQPAFNGYLPPIETGAAISELPLEHFAKNNEKNLLEIQNSSEVVESISETPQETAVKAADGYHYKKPDHIPDLSPSQNLKAEYLPPLEKGVVEVEGPTAGESAVLKSDGYHYRTIKNHS